MFLHENGSFIETKVAKLRGTITARSENLYGCNRYYVQPEVIEKEMKVPDGWWVDEGDINVIIPAIAPAPDHSDRPDKPGGPMDRVR